MRLLIIAILTSLVTLPVAAQTIRCSSTTGQTVCNGSDGTRVIINERGSQLTTTGPTVTRDYGIRFTDTVDQPGGIFGAGLRQLQTR